MSAKGVDGGEVGGAVVSPGSYIVQTALDVFGGKYHQREPTGGQIRRLEERGYERTTLPAAPGRRGPIPVWRAPDGTLLSENEAWKVARAIKRAGVSPVDAMPPPSSSSSSWSWAAALPFLFGAKPAPRRAPRRRRRAKPKPKPKPRPRPAVPRRGPGGLPDYKPPTPRAVPGLPVLLTRLTGAVGGLLWPSEIGREPPWQPPPSVGPPVHSPVTVPAGQREPAQQPQPQPRTPQQPANRVQPRPAPTPRPQPTASPVPAPVVLSQPLPMPAPSSYPAPAPLPTPRSFPWQYLVPFLPLAFSPSPGSRGAPAPLTGVQPTPLGFTGQQPQPEAENDPCKRCAQQRRRRRKRKECRNPRVSSKTYTRGGKRFQTITRRLECQASSRKKLRSPRVR